MSSLSARFHCLLGHHLVLLVTLGACSESSPVPEGAPSGPAADGASPVRPGEAGKADGFKGGAYAPLPEGAVLDAELAALFAPDDPVGTTELRLIDDVRAARLADGGDYAEGENPFRIRYAVYNLRNPEIVDALAGAEEDGVDVQILIDAKQLDPARTWNTADERLVERGFELVTDHRELDDVSRVLADMVGIRRSGLMHLKARLFETPAGARLLTGSMNPGDNAMLNEETLHVVTQAEVVAAYAAAYEAILEGARIPNRWIEDAPLNVLFTPAASGPRAGERLMRWIEEESEAILLMVFSLRDVRSERGSLVDLLAAKVREGVPVYVITDRKQSDGVDADGASLYRDDDTEDRLREAGVHVYEATNRRTEFTAMHHKAGIFGLTAPRVVTDAANWTFSGLGSASRVARNYESQLFIEPTLDGGETGRRYLAQWVRVLERYAAQSPEEPAFEEVFGRLRALPAWPEQPLHFRARVETSFGEHVAVRGDLPALGAWESGVPLTTNAAEYPWWSTTESVALPLGAAFAHKLTAARNPGGLRWEGGENRRSYARPEALLPGTPVLELIWR